MRLEACSSVVDVGRWIQNHGFAVGEGPDPFGPISQTAHVPNSLHYQLRALDVNYYDRERWATEPEALTWLYNKILRVEQRHPKQWPLDELFFNGWGYMKEYGVDVNHPIGAHDNHLHVGFKANAW